MSQAAFQLDPQRRELRLGQRVVRLSPLGLQLMEVLVERAGEVVSRDDAVRLLEGLHNAGSRPDRVTEQ